MENAEQSQLGIVVLHDPPDANIDIVAVHGLGANPDWAWIRKVKHDNNELKVNWLADKHLLPAAIPTARIMTFNYESRWHRDAPWQRRSLCANQLITALDNMRKERWSDEARPLIFIGHSFGGIVIEEAIIQANLDASLQYLSTSTAGILFLGTTHRGTEASKWGESIAVLGSKLGFETQDSILKDLKKDSETLADLLHQFSLWLFRLSVPAVCFFEQHKTDYGKRFGFSWKEMVVDERSACIDGHRKVPLPVDHLKINKFEGPDDICYKTVAPIIKQIALHAQDNVQMRMQPRTIANDNSLIPSASLKCMQSLFLTNPVDDLAAIRRNKGERVNGTCEWLLVHPTYANWVGAETSQLLRLIGGPGIGKTMISSFLVEELEQKATKTPEMTFAYYFCDNKDERRSSALAILRGLLLQLLRLLGI